MTITDYVTRFASSVIAKYNINELFEASWHIPIIEPIVAVESSLAAGNVLLCIS